MTTTTMPTPAAHAAGVSAVRDTRPWFTYERRSRIGKGAALTMNAQHAENAGYIRAIDPAAEIVDFRDNASGWDESKFRDGWESMLAAIAEGNARGVVGWHSDRYTRQPAQLEQLIAACRRGGAQLHTRLGGHHADPTMIRIEMALAAKESDTKSERLKLKHVTKAAHGEFHGGRRRFGYDAHMTATIPAEADAIRSAARRILAGESLGSIARDWNGQNLMTAEGKAWRSQNLGKMMRGAHLAGLRRHRGVITAATWPAIIDRPTHEALVRFLTNPERRVTPAEAGRVYALSGVLRCAVCGGPCYGRPTGLKSGPAYQCRNNTHVQAPVNDVDGTIRELVIERLTMVDAAGIFVDPDDAAEAEARRNQRDALAARREELPRALARGILTPEMVAEAVSVIDADIAAIDRAEAEADDARRTPARVLDGLTGAGYAETAARFDALPADRQRAVVAVLGRPTLAKAPRKGVGLPWVPERLTFEWAAVD